uniref:Uncharacterized protein n=1 Tax=Brassica oleracea TaxID=3712 RepID=A0A3P6BW81_BRAOL|nr:unnamed protein product [Brassica oleracea]
MMVMLKTRCGSSSSYSRYRCSNLNQTAGPSSSRKKANRGRDQGLLK